MSKSHQPYSEELMFYVCNAFLEGEKAEQIAQRANARYKPEPPLTRQSVYKVMAEAREYGMLWLAVPMEQQLAKQITERFGCGKDTVHVVSTLSEKDNHLVAAVAARLALDLIRDLAKEKARDDVKPKDLFVGIGLGVGRATLDFSDSLSKLLKAEIDFPKLKLFATSAGCPIYSPEYSSASFFNLFPKRLVAGRVGLFASALVTQRDFQEMKKRGGLREAFRVKEEISLVVNSMGDFVDPDDLLLKFLAEEEVKIDQLVADGWVGNVQYRPFSATGPIVEKPDEKRAVCLFELDEFTAWSKRRDKRVILIARQCGRCGRTRAEGLLPLLTVPELRVFQHLVLDVATAKELVNGPASSVAEPSAAAPAPREAVLPAGGLVRRRAR